MTSVTLQVGAQALAIELDAENAPGIAAALLRSVPHSTIAVHTTTAGAEFCVPVPWFRWHENRRPPGPGDVGYASFGNYLCFYYGAMSHADGPTNVVGRVRSPDALDAIGRSLLSGGARRAWVAADADVDARDAPPGLPPISGPMRSFRSAARSLLEAALDHPPSDIARLRRVELPAMGNVAGRLQASTLLLAVAELLFQARTSVVASPRALPSIAALLATQLVRYARWLAMSGMDGTSDWLASAARHLESEMFAVDEFAAALEDALVAFGRLRFWADAIGPWHALAAELGTDDHRWIHTELLT
jgi:hypothetical protein